MWNPEAVKFNKDSGTIFHFEMLKLWECTWIRDAANVWKVCATMWTILSTLTAHLITQPGSHCRKVLKGLGHLSLVSFQKAWNSTLIMENFKILVNLVENALKLKINLKVREATGLKHYNFKNLKMLPKLVKFCSDFFKLLKNKSLWQALSVKNFLNPF